MKVLENYGVKGYHGLFFGLYHFIDDRMIVKDHSMGGSLRRVNNQMYDQIPKDATLFQFGNIWGLKQGNLFHERSRFIHPQRLLDGGWEYFYWDNPTLPHILYKGFWNPEGYKNWCRLTHNTTSPHNPIENMHGARRINAQLKHLTKGSIVDWRDIVGGIKQVEHRKGGVALLCPSSREMFLNYYDKHLNFWIQEKTKKLQNMGYKVEVRVKPGRPQRETHDGKLYERLRRGDVSITVGCHSMGAIESLLAGVPAIVEGAHSGGACATPWDEFVQGGEVRVPLQSAVERHANYMLNYTYHKLELYDGTWFKQHSLIQNRAT